MCYTIDIIEKYQYSLLQYENGKYLLSMSIMFIKKL